MAKEINLEILEDGRLRFKRGDKGHNENMMVILTHLLGKDHNQMEELSQFFYGSEDVELLVGDTILCG